MNVLVFDPRRGPDQARQYAAKYCSKPEPWYFLETEKNGLKDWLKARTVGLCMAFNRILHFHVVRSTRPVQWQPAEFVPKKDSCVPRDPSHITNNPDYPDEQFYMSHLQKYFFRHENPRHLRPEVFNRYLSLAGDEEASPPPHTHDGRHAGR